MELKRIEHLQAGFQFQKMAEDFDTTNEKECFLCFYDLHMSAATCKCSSDRFSCLKHAYRLCSCDPGQRSVYLRYTFDELTMIVDSLEGQSDALKKWASRNLDHRKCPIKEESSNLSHNHGSLSVVKSGQHKEEPLLGLKYSLDSNFGKVCVELINIGSLAFGKLWCNKQVIFPKGV